MIRLNIKRALITVYDKSGLEELAAYLTEKGVEIISTEGTYEYLKMNGIPVRSIGEYSDGERLFGGRIKTISPKLVGGILADRSNEEHIEQMISENIPEIDMLVVNFCPFKSFAEDIYDEYELVQKIDIGGINLVRAAAKNYRSVLPVVDPADYKKIMANFELCGDVPLQNRRRYALKAFYNTMRYEESIHQALSFLFAEEKYEHMTFEKLYEFKYGENPHQSAYLSKVADEESLFGQIKFIVKKRLTLRLYRQLYSGLDFMRNITSKGFVILINFLPVYFSNNENDADYLRGIKEELLHNSNNNTAFITKGVIDGETADFIKETGINVVVATSFEDDAKRKLESSDVIILAEFNEIKSGKNERIFFDNELVIQQNDKLEDFGSLNGVYLPNENDKEYSSDLLIMSQIIKSLETCSLIGMKDGRMYGMASGMLNVEECFSLCGDRFETSLKNVNGGFLGFDIFPSADVILKAKKEWGIETILIPDNKRINAEFLEMIKTNKIGLYTFTKRHFK